jgi:hypothetical protein
MYRPRGGERKAGGRLVVERAGDRLTASGGDAMLHAMKTVRLLTIGNSFADNALTYLEPLAESTGEARFIVGRANIGGCSLEKHWNLAQYTLRHPEHKTYNLNASGAPRAANLREALLAEAWDAVTLQQVSPKSWRPETFQPHLDLLRDLTRQLAPRATLFLHQTWAYRCDSPFLPQNGLTAEMMSARIRDTYAHFAAALRCRVLPSGEAVRQARQAPDHRFVWPDPDYDYQGAAAPVLPRQEEGLAVGWHWEINNSAEGVPELRLDPNHLNARGCYLIGCVWLESLAGVDARAAAFTPPEVDAASAAFLRATAHDVCRRYASAS